MSTPVDFNFFQHAKSDPATDKPAPTNQHIQLSLLDLMRAKIEINQRAGNQSEVMSDNKYANVDNNVNIKYNLNTDTKYNSVDNLDTMFTSVQSSPVENPVSDPVNTVDFVYINSEEKLAEAIASLQNVEVLGIDTETTGLRPELGDRIRLIQIAAANYPVCLIDCFKVNPQEQLNKLFNSKTLIFHNASFDLKFLLAMGIKVTGSIFDTMIAESLLSYGAPKSLKLQAIAKKYLGIELDKQEQKGEWGAGNLSPSQLQYAALDAQILLDLRDKLKPLLINKGMGDVAKIEFDCCLATAIMELNGIGVEAQGWKDYIQYLIPLQQQLKDEIIGMLPPVPAPPKKSRKSSANQVSLIPLETMYKTPTLNSTKYLGEAFTLAGYPLPELEGKISFAHDVLKRYALKNPKILVVAKLLEYKKLEKLLSSFGIEMLDKQIVNGRLYPSFNQTATVTGRYSCSSPNIQQLPGEVRGFIFPSPGHKFIQADYSQMELRAAASIFGEGEMRKAFENGVDIHTLTASKIFGGDVTKEQRSVAKTINFGILYGMGANKLAQNLTALGIETTQKKAQEFLDAFKQGYQAIAQIITQSQYAREGHIITTRSGRKIILGKGAPQQIKNFPIQSICADANKLALSRLVRELPDYCKLVASIHDEVLIEVPEDKTSSDELRNLVSQIMIESAKRFLPDVPVVCDAKYIDNWGEK